MNNNMKTGKKLRNAVIAVVLVLLTGAVAVLGILTDGFTKWGRAPETGMMLEQPGGGIMIGESEGSGVTLMSAKIAKEDYAAYGISPMAESAQLLTATVEPVDAMDKSVDWSIAFVNPTSAWASGKTVTDYVTVTPTEDGALTATVTNLQAFGEQAVVTVTSRENPEVSATCTVDYAQRLTGASLSFGDIDTVYQGETPVTWEVATNVQGNGGKAEFEYTTNDVYTVADEYTVEYHVDNTYAQPSGSEFTGFTVSDALATDIENGENIYFDCSFFYDYVTAEIGVTISKNGWQSGFTNIFMSPIASQSDPGNYFTIDLTVTVDGTYSDYIYYTSITVGGLMNNSVITGLTLDENGIIF